MKAEAIPPAPVAVPMLRHLREKARKPRLEPMNVRVPETTLAALERYTRHHGVTKQVAVTDMLDAMLEMQGFKPGSE